MKVAFVIDVDYPHVGEIRPRKMARSLREAGHEALFICPNSRTRPATEDVESGPVFRFALFLNSFLFRVLARAFPLNPFWVAWIWLVGRREQVDCFVTSNIRLSLPTILAARLLGKPAVLDLQENNPAAVRSYPKTSLSDYILKNGTFVAVLEWLCVRFSDHTWVVVEERVPTMPERERRLGKVSVVCHTPALDEIRPLPGSKASKADHFTLAYVGLFAPGVGSVELILDAMREVLQQDREVYLRIAGGRQIEPLVRQLGLQDHVLFDGIIAPHKLPDWLEPAHLGIIAYKVNEITNTTISNKLFHYMASGVAVLSTDMIPTRRVVEQAACGRLIQDSATPSEVAELILELKRNTEECVAMGARGREAVRTHYNWQHDFDHMLECLLGLTSGKRPPARASAAGMGNRAASVEPAAHHALEAEAADALAAGRGSLRGPGPGSE